jgi:hypothetical protein
MSPSPSRRRRSKGKAAAGGKGARRSAAKRSRAKAGRPKKAQPPRIDPDRPFWANDEGEAEVRAITGSVRSTRDPTALVRSLGSPPIGRFADSAEHYYAPVYEKAQRFAIAMATANGVLLVDGGDDDDGSATAADGGDEGLAG